MQKSSIRMKDISIEFPGVKALQNVDFEMKAGTIHALIGANGAGKSTLMKVLSGAYTHYTGEIYIDGKSINMDSPKKAKQAGIDIVYQEVDTALIPYLNVAENIMLDVMANDMKGKSFVNWKQIHEKAKEVLKRLNIRIDTNKKVMDLQLAEKQMVLIARAIVQDRKFLILDEPTAPLSQKETDELFRILRDLASNHHIGIIFISHRLPELFAICENISIMKDGKMVATSKIEEITPKRVVELMLGKSFTESHKKQLVETGKVLLEVENLTEKEQKVKDISITVSEGEIVGLAGLVGAGKTELCKTIFGMNKVLSGSMKMKGKKVVNKTPYHAVRNGIGLVPEERRKEGVLVEEPVYKNLTAANLSEYSRKLSFLNPSKEKAVAREMIKDLGIKTPDELQKVSLLSGGNQQKVAVGKWLLTNTELLLFDEPTKGVDIGAKGDIFDLINKLAIEGKGIIYASSELNEIMQITDRIYVMYDGMIVKELKTAETTEEEVLYYSTGGK